MRLAAVLLLALAAPAPAQEPARADFLSRVTFPTAEEVAIAARKDPVRTRVLKLVLDKEHWRASLKRVEDALGPVDGGVRVEVLLADVDGANHAMVEFDAVDEDLARLTFFVGTMAKNERDLEEFTRENERLKKRREPLLKWINPCLRLDTILPHELVHVWERGACPEDWFFEGLGAWVAGQDEMIVGCLNQEKALREIGEKTDNPESLYGRGFLFLQWLEAKGGAGTVRKAATRVFHGDEALPSVLEDLLKQPWAELRKLELAAAKAEAARRKK